MARERTVHRCSACGVEHPRWSGRCAGCGAWNALEPEVLGATAGDTADALGSAGRAAVQPVAITELGGTGAAPVPTGLDEADRVLGGGFVPGSVTLLAGEPGVGKSTLVLQLLAARARHGEGVLYATGEESSPQVAARAARIDAAHPGILVADVTSVPALVDLLAEHRPAMCVVDSVQTLQHPAATGAPGTPAQVRDCTLALTEAAGSFGVTMVVVGHVTKDGAIAGPRVLEHVVDTVLTLDGDRHHDLRVLRAEKHRFGSTREVGLFRLEDSGLVGVPDASGWNLSDRHPGTPGAVVTVAVEGRRPMLVEVQGLAAPSALAQPRRSAKGLDAGRLALLLAVLHRRAQVPVARCDVHTMAVGGVTVREPAADLAICLAVTSSLCGTALPDGLVAVGEVGLGGELRRVGRMEQRLAEAARLGFTAALVPQSAPASFEGLDVLRVPALETALVLFDLAEPRTSRRVRNV